MPLIDGRKIAGEVIANLKAKPKPDKFLGAVLVGDDPASQNFLKQKERAGKELGIDFRLYQLPADTTTDKLRAEIGRLAGAKNCGGLIVQLPLPQGVNRHYVLNAIPAGKDPDMLSEAALGAFYTGRSGLVPPAVETVKDIISREKRDLRAENVVLIGAGFLIGRPVGYWLLNKVAQLTVLDSKTADLRVKLKDADIVISGVGRQDIVTSDDLKTGALVIDFGCSKKGDKVVGDFNPGGAEAKNISYTPTPGGTGPILVAKLFQNFYLLNSE